MTRSPLGRPVPSRYLIRTLTWGSFGSSFSLRTVTALFVIFTACAFAISIAALSVAANADTRSGATLTEGDMIARANKAQQGFVMGNAAGKVLFKQVISDDCVMDIPFFHLTGAHVVTGADAMYQVRLNGPAPGPTVQTGAYVNGNKVIVQAAVLNRQTGQVYQRMEITYTFNTAGKVSRYFEDVWWHSPQPGWYPSMCFNGTTGCVNSSTLGAGGSCRSTHTRLVLPLLDSPSLGIQCHPTIEGAGTEEFNRHLDGEVRRGRRYAQRGCHPNIGRTG